MTAFYNEIDSQPRLRNRAGRFTEQASLAGCGTYGGFYAARYRKLKGQANCGPCDACRQAKRDYDNSRTTTESRVRWARNRAQARYGITIEEKLAIFAEQGNACAVCRAEIGLHDPLNWATEHNHRTGEVRGVTCRHCNHLIGMAGKIAGSEDPDRLGHLLGRDVLEYLRNGASLVRDVLKKARS